MRSPKEKRRQNSRRNSRTRRNIVADVLSQHGAQCWLCETPIDLELEAPHPMSLSMDHVTPHWMGGRFCRENLRPAHRDCNHKRAGRAA